VQLFYSAYVREGERVCTSAERQKSLRYETREILKKEKRDKSIIRE
jgi:hypothetical protein